MKWIDSFNFGMGEGKHIAKRRAAIDGKTAHSIDRISLLPGSSGISKMCDGCAPMAYRMTCGTRRIGFYNIYVHL